MTSPDSLHHWDLRSSRSMLLEPGSPQQMVRLVVFRWRVLYKQMVSRFVHGLGPLTATYFRDLGPVGSMHIPSSSNPQPQQCWDLALH